jgi:hypothetical protein
LASTTTGALVATPTLTPAVRRGKLPVWTKVVLGIGAIGVGVALVVAFRSSSTGSAELHAATSTEPSSLASPPSATVAPEAIVTPSPSPSPEPEPVSSLEVPDAAATLPQRTLPRAAVADAPSGVRKRHAAPHATHAAETGAQPTTRPPPDNPPPAPNRARKAEEPTDFGF